MCGLSMNEVGHRTNFCKLTGIKILFEYAITEENFIQKAGTEQNFIRIESLLFIFFC